VCVHLYVSNLTFVYDTCDVEELVCVCGNVCVSISMLWNSIFAYETCNGQELVCLCVCGNVCVCV
jgi:hypothetical protein